MLDPVNRLPSDLPNCTLQAKSIGAQFLTVNIKEEGESGTGYSKEMSKAFIDAEVRGGGIARQV